MRKKFLSALLAVLIVMSLSSISALAAESNTDVAYAVEGGNIYFEKTTGIITDCDNTVTKAVIPAKIEGVAVTDIGNNAFNNCEKLVSIDMPEGITSIGNNAFYYCESLTDVIIPDGTVRIGSGAFYCCKNLSRVEIPGSVVSIGSEAFYNCSGLKRVTLPDGVNCVFDSVFQGCTSLTSVLIPNSVMYIYGYAFQGCTSLKSVTIPEGVLTVDAFAFSGCSVLKTVNLPHSLEIIGNSAFRYCSMLADVNYSGSEEEWKAIGIDYNNEPLASATVHYGTGAQTANFSDVAAGSYCYDAVQWAVANGITNGTDATHFSPNAGCTRGQVVTFLWRAAGEPTVSGNVGFVDVAPGSYCYEAVKWAVANGITKGTDATHFSPNATCTRGQVVTFMYRAEGEPAVGGSNGFVDVAAGSYCYNAVQWAVANGITKGTDTTHFSPNATCTRGQVVTFLYRAQ